MQRLKEIQTRGGFNYDNTFITDPYIDMTGRYEVDPKEYYNLSEEELNAIHKKG